jgi:hypothetical protein
MSSPVDAENSFRKIWQSNNPLTELRWVLLVISILLFGSAYAIAQQVLAVGVTFTPRAERWLMVIGLVVLGLLDFIVIATSWTTRGNNLLSKLARIPDRFHHFRWVFWLILGLVVYAFPYLVLNLMGDLLIDMYPRLLLFCVLAIIGAVSLRVLYPKLSSRSAAVAITLIIVFVYQIATLLTQVTDYPFSLGWSETSRYYYGSLFAAEKVYGLPIPPSVLHPTRYLMQSLPFWVGTVSLWGHRFWQVFLWVFFNIWTAYLFARRLQLRNKARLWLLAIWIYFFLFQAPIYYHLTVPLILILGWFNPQKFWRNLILVVLASAWAGISRVNWYPLPGMLAAMLYLLEEKQADTPLWRYLLPAAVWTILGTAVAFVSQMLYVVWSGNDPDSVTSSFSSDLLWYRLFPNTTYPLGIIINVLLVSLPVLWLIIARLWSGRGRWSWIRMLGLWAILLAFFVGGLVVSVKIGGGSNLHNVDAYIVLLLVMGAYVYFDRFDPDNTENNVETTVSYSWIMTLIVLAAPVFLMLRSGGPLKLPDARIVAASLDAVHQHIDYAARDGGEVLFISQRHLTYFDEQVNVAMIPDYEKVFFMEMVMSKNPNYLNAFYHDLENQRYAAIISDQTLEYDKDRREAWSEEHNIWVQLVSRPMLCYYQPRLTLRVVHLQILFPRPDVGECKSITENQIEFSQGLP